MKKLDSVPGSILHVDQSIAAEVGMSEYSFDRATWTVFIGYVVPERLGFFLDRSVLINFRFYMFFMEIDSYFSSLEISYYSCDVLRV